MARALALHLGTAGPIEILTQHLSGAVHGRHLVS